VRHGDLLSVTKEDSSANLPVHHGINVAHLTSEVYKVFGTLNTIVTLILHCCIYHTHGMAAVDPTLIYCRC
jgi:hypothetical protein